MSDHLTKAQWKRALTHRWIGPAPLRATLLLVSDNMTQEGALSMEREALALRIGVARRTLDRHLAKATDVGWLILSQRACFRTFAVYQATSPIIGCTPQMARNTPELHANHGGATHAQSCMPSGGMLKEPYERSECVAVELAPSPQLDDSESGMFVRISDGSRLHLTSWVASLGKSDLTIGRPTRPLRHSPVTAGLLSDVDREPASSVSGMRNG